jgi:hypothetical protein
MLRKWVLHAVLLVLGLGMCTGVYAQSSTVGSISGQIKDPQGRVIPGAEVVIKEETTDQERTVRADSDGYYSVQSLPVGVYTVSTTAQGFKNTVAPGIQVHVGDKIVVDLALEPGGINEVVTVTDAATLIETERSDVSSLISETQVKELPLNGRNYAQLALMVPGVSPSTNGGFATGGTGLNSGVDMSVNGNASNANMWTVDGVNNMDVGSNRTLLVFPSIDSIEEFRVERNSFSAEFGGAQGAVINLVTKGGSNEFHGAGFWFFRNDALNAKNFFLNLADQEKNELSYHNYGGNFSGPIIKDRIFFFWSEEWRRERRGIVLSGRVPTAAEKIGDFSGPLTGPLPHFPGGDPFPGNRIPANLISPAGLALLRLYPDPNVPNPTAPGNNWLSSTTQPIDTRQDLVRGDFVVTDRMNVMVRWINETWTHERANGNFWGDSPFPTLSSDWNQPSHSFAVKSTNQIGSTMVNEFQFSAAGNDILITRSPETEALASEISSQFPTVFPHEGVVVPSLFWGPGGYTDLWHEAPWSNREDLYIWKDDFSKVAGEHSLKFGALFSHNIKDEQNIGNNEIAQIGFGGAGDGRTGSVLGDLLLRDTVFTNYIENSDPHIVPGRWHDLEFYGNDSWKMHPRVTLNLGLRYSRFSAAYANDDRISNYFPELYDGVDPLSGLVRADEAEALGIPRSLVDTYNNGWQPRVGFAWDLTGDGKTALRAGFGRYLGRANVIEDVLRLAGNPPWNSQVNSGWAGSSNTLEDCPTCRSLDTINPGLVNAIAGVGTSTAFRAIQRDFHPPESWQWNLTVSREVMADTVLELSYVGNDGSHIWRRNVNINAVPPGQARLDIAQAVRDNQGTDALIAANRLFPNLGPITTSMSNGESNYHALQVWLNRRFSHGLAYQASYTWGHTISNVALQAFTDSLVDPFNFDIDRGDADLDRRHSFVGNVVYMTPSLESWGDVASGVLGNWQFNAIATFYSGTPANISSGVNTAGLTNGNGTRPDLVPGVPIYLDHDNNPLTFLNPAAFQLPQVGSFGTLGRGVIRNPGYKNVDMSLTKNWPFGERYNVQFRSEFFNVFNHPNFSGLNTSLSFDGTAGDGTFGTVGNGNFGRLNTASAAREIQFGLKFQF